MNQQPNWNTYYPSAFSRLSKSFRPPLGKSWTSPFPWPMELEARLGLLIINQTCTLTQRQPQSQSQRKEQCSSYFIYNLLTTEWKLIEAAGSKWLPVCQHQMAAPALTPLDRSSLTLPVSAQDSQECYGSLPRFYLCQLYTDAIPLPQLSCFRFRAVRTDQDLPHLSIYCTCVFVGQILYLHTLCSAGCQCSAHLNNLILLG